MQGRNDPMCSIIDHGKKLAKLFSGRFGRLEECCKRILKNGPAVKRSRILPGFRLRQACENKDAYGSGRYHAGQIVTGQMIARRTDGTG